MPPEQDFIRAGRIPTLDGCRAIAIFGVLLAHSKHVPNFPNVNLDFFGYLGVRFFFVISGFLITALLLRENSRRGSINFASFYRRRCLRIFPAYYSFLLFVFLLQATTPFNLPTLEWIACLTFTRNFVMNDWLTGHLWSLAVEQQFYLIWPALFALRISRRIKILGLAAIILASPFAPILVHLGVSENLLNVHSFLHNSGALAAGCLLALFYWYDQKQIEGIFRKRIWLLFAISLLFIISPLLWPQDLRGILFLCRTATESVSNIGLASLLIVTTLGGTFMTRFLELSSMKFLGAISYSVYIWQQFFCTNPKIYGGSWHLWNSFPFWIVSSLGVAIASYHLIEQPFLRLKNALANSQ